MLLSDASANALMRWDIFCNVIDNYGDIGVCWRLARQLSAEYGFSVRLWVDDLAAFQRICPDVEAGRAAQQTHGVEVRRWEGDFADIVPGDVVIEAFACRLPERFEKAMAAHDPKPVWINLDYLSAEAWVSGCHALPSPHPRLPLTKYFFFPGFTETTGGLLREHDLEEQRTRYCASSAEQGRFWNTLGFLPPDPDAMRISLFSYENAAIPDLLDAWKNGTHPVCCLVPLTRNQAALETWTKRRLQTGDVFREGHLELRIVPFVPQPDFDRLLWSCDMNFVRGEDSFVRAQWAARPMLWQIYPQTEEAHRVKLDAFLDLYCADMSETTATTVRQGFLAWNGGIVAGRMTRGLWRQWQGLLPELGRHAVNWQKKLEKQQDLCRNLVLFCRSKL